MQMKKCRLGAYLGIALLMTILVCIVTGYQKRDVVIVTANSPNGQSASIVAHKDSILGTYSADLIFCSADGKELQRKNLIQSRDDIEDVRVEFVALEFRDGAVRLNSRGLHYHGSNEFSFHECLHGDR